MTDNALACIGNTPLVRINRLNPNPQVNIWAKVEGLNLGGSIKDRPALYMVTKAEESGALHPGKVILEPTSGNTGIGLALIAAVKGYRLRLTMPSCMSIERHRILEAFGAEVILTPANKGTDGAIEMAQKMFAEEPEKYFMPNQFDNPYNVLSHYETTAWEIWNQTKGQIDYLVAGMGTTGTLMGCSKRLKELKPSVKIIGVEPYPGHAIQGLKNMSEARVPKIYDRSLLDEVIMAHDAPAFETSRELVSKEGIFAGISSGAAMYAAMEKARQIKSGNIVVILPDRGEKYLSVKNFCGRTCELKI